MQYYILLWICLKILKATLWDLFPSLFTASAPLLKALSVPQESTPRGLIEMQVLRPHSPNDFMHHHYAFIYVFFVRVCSVVSDSLQSHGLLPTRLLCPWDSPGKDAEVGCHAVLQRSFPTQGLDPHLFRLLHLQAGSLPLHHLGSPPVLQKTPKLWMPTIPHSILCLYRALPGTDT